MHQLQAETETAAKAGVLKTREPRRMARVANALRPLTSSCASRKNGCMDFKCVGTIASDLYDVTNEEHMFDVTIVDDCWTQTSLFDFLAKSFLCGSNNLVGFIRIERETQLQFGPPKQRPSSVLR